MARHGATYTTRVLVSTIFMVPAQKRRPRKDTIQKVLTTLERQHQPTMLESLTPSDPFRILIGTILSARSRDDVTSVVVKDLFKEYPTARALSQAKPSQVIPIIRKIGFYRVKARTIISAAKMVIHDFNGKVPQDYENLLKIPGVGRKVAGCVLVNAFDLDALPVDTHVHRISNRLGWVMTQDPERTEQALLEMVPPDLWKDVNNLFVHHGKTVCKPIGPKCPECTVIKWCKRVGLH